MSAVDDILSHVSLSELASRLGTDEQTAGAAVQQAIPALLGGMQANAQDPAGAASLEGALAGHSAGLIDGGVNLDDIDPADGRKIVGHVFGEHADGVAQTLGGLGGLGGNQSDLMRRLLPLLAPIVMSYLAKRLGGTGGGLLGSLLGRAAGSSSGGLGDLLGGMLGGGSETTQQEQQSGGSITDILGGLLGAGRR